MRSATPSGRTQGADDWTCTSIERFTGPLSFCSATSAQAAVQGVEPRGAVLETACLPASTLLWLPAGRTGAGVTTTSATPRSSRLGADAERSGPGGARTLVCGFSGRRYTISATSPTKKPGVTGTCDTGFLETHRDARSSVTSAKDARAGHSPIDRRSALCILVRLLYLT